VAVHVTRLAVFLAAVDVGVVLGRFVLIAYDVGADPAECKEKDE
jgi:hypothetical protein